MPDPQPVASQRWWLWTDSDGWLCVEEEEGGADHRRNQGFEVLPVVPEAALAQEQDHSAQLLDQVTRANKLLETRFEDLAREREAHDTTTQAHKRTADDAALWKQQAEWWEQRQQEAVDEVREVAEELRRVADSQLCTGEVNDWLRVLADRLVPSSGEKE